MIKSSLSLVFLIAINSSLIAQIETCESVSDNIDLELNSIVNV